jgi:hypothetical protein
MFFVADVSELSKNHKKGVPRGKHLMSKGGCHFFFICLRAFPSKGYICDLYGFKDPIPLLITYRLSFIIINDNINK